MVTQPSRTTARIVAEAAGVSVGTVSHALNGTGRVAVATRARVAAVAVELGYRPDPRGRALRSGRTSTLALVLPAAEGSQRPGEFVDASFYLELAGAAAQAALARDHGLLLLPSPRKPSDLERFSFDGALLSDPDADDPRLPMFDALGIPVVTLERDAAHPERSWWVAGDTIADTRGLLDHLGAAGARSIALFTLPKAWSWLADTESAYRDWCAHAGMPAVVETIAGGTSDAAPRRGRRPPARTAPARRRAGAAGEARVHGAPDGARRRSPRPGRRPRRGSRRRSGRQSRGDHRA